MADWHGINVGNNTEHWQQILNQSWPLIDDNGNRHARGIPHRDPIDVRVRVVFERDGEVWLEGQARRWYDCHVYVEVGDPRMQVRGAWVDAADVRRLSG